MKHVICALLAASSLTALAGEPKQAAAPPAAGDAVQKKLQAALRRMEARANTCYFIRTLRPLPAPAPALRPHMVPLQDMQAQARITGIVHGPDCTSGGELIPVPVTRTVPAPSRNGAGR